MDWGDAKGLVIEAVGYDGDTSKSLTTTGVGSATDTWLQILLRNFSIETFSFFTRSTPVTFQDGDWENVDLTDLSRCPLSMAKVISLNLNGTMLGKADGVGVLGRSGLTAGDTTGIPAKGTPLSWAESDVGKVSLDRPVDMSANPPAWAMGWYRHPVIAYDSAALARASNASPTLARIQLDEMLVFAWSKYAAIFLKENVTSSQSAMARLKRFDTQAFSLIIQKRGENFSRYARGLFGNSTILCPDFGYFGQGF